MSKTRTPHWAPAYESLQSHTCGCGKRTYFSRKVAKDVIKRVFPGSSMNAYRCPTSDEWHIGHLPKAVINGSFSRADLR